MSITEIRRVQERRQRVQARAVSPLAELAFARPRARGPVGLDKSRLAAMMREFERMVMVAFAAGVGLGLILSALFSQLR